MCRSVGLLLFCSVDLLGVLFLCCSNALWIHLSAGWLVLLCGCILVPNPIIFWPKWLGGLLFSKFVHFFVCWSDALLVCFIAGLVACWSVCLLVCLFISLFIFNSVDY